ncbi:MAG: two component regulator propeller protein [uncultured bacterium]|nr:MAG: two component regulator propeller protein [uncultured bacterium]
MNHSVVKKVGLYPLIFFMLISTIPPCYAYWKLSLPEQTPVTSCFLREYSYYISTGTVFRIKDVDFKNPTIITRGLEEKRAHALFFYNDKIYVGTNKGVFKLTDDTMGWEDISGKMLANKCINSLCSHNGCLYAGTGSGVFKLDTDLTSWIEVPGLEFKLVKAVYSHGDSLYAGTIGHGVFKINTDEQWTEFNTGLPTTISVNALYSYDDCLYAGTSNGVFKLDADTKSWQEFNVGFQDQGKNTIVHTLCSDINYLYAQTKWGYFRTKTRQETSE